MLGPQSIAPKAKRKRRDGGTSPSLEVSRLGDENGMVDVVGINNHAGPSRKNVDDLLPVGVSTHRWRDSRTGCLRGYRADGFQRLPAPPAPRKAFKAAARKEWAHVVDVNQELVNVRYPSSYRNFADTSAV